MAWIRYKLAGKPPSQKPTPRFRSIASRYAIAECCWRCVLKILMRLLARDSDRNKIQIGRETPVAEAYTAFQEYCLALRDRGVLLAVCSKNTDEIARSGFRSE